MKSRLLLTIVLILSLLISVTAQSPSPTATKEAAAQDKRDAATSDKQDVVRISVTLVQIDVTVTDNKGRLVTDLKADDFEVLQNNHSQPITNFSYINATPATPTPAPAAKSAAKNSPVEPPAPPARLRPEQVRRTIALVVDDLTLSFGSTASVRQALKKYVDEQMQPGDLVAIIRTGAGMGALQQFTNDKRQLYAAIERVRWSPTRGTLYTFAPVSSDPSRPILTGPGSQESSAGFNVFNPLGVNGATTDSFERARTGTPAFGGSVAEDVARLRQEIFSIGTLGALSFIVRGLRELPGRKSVVLFSDALRIYNREQGITRVKQALDNLTDLANRAAVNLYTIDARGLEVFGMTAADGLAGEYEVGLPAGANQTPNPYPFLTQMETTETNRRSEFYESQEGLRDLAQRTGGLFVQGTNDLSKGIDLALRDQSSYYLLGFVPEAATFKNKNGSREYQNIAVRVKRPGLRVRARTGFYGVTDEETRPVNNTTAQQLLVALASPFGARDVRVRMTPQFWHDPKGGAFINALLHIDARDLTFAETVNGWRKTSFEVAAFTFGDNGQVIDQSHRVYTVNMSDKDYRHTLEAGIFYRINLPIKKPGAYQLRAAVRDVTTKKLGAANEFIDVPDVKKGKLTLSGVIVRGAEAPSAGRPEPVSAGEQAANTREGKVDESQTQANPAVRRFQRGQVIEYGYIIYNAQLDKTTRQPLLETQLRVYRDGQPVFTGRFGPFNLQSQTDVKRLIGGGSLRLGNALAPGDYALQVIVVDKLAKTERRMTTQWIDFEIVK